MGVASVPGRSGECGSKLGGNARQQDQRRRSDIGGRPASAGRRDARKTAEWLLTESAGASSWTVVRTQDPATQAQVLTASILRESPRAPNAPKRYRGDNGAAEVFGKALSALLDGKTQFTYPVDEASEKIFKGAKRNIRHGCGAAHCKTETFGVSKLAVPLSEQTLAVGNHLPQPARQALSVCFTASSASR